MYIDLLILDYKQKKQMKNQQCHLFCPIILLLHGAYIVRCYEDTCDIVRNYKCTVNVTRRYGFNIYNPDIMDRVPILKKTDFAELCSEYVSMLDCLKVNSPCDYRSRRYTKYALALAKGLDYACRPDVLEDYDAVVSCFQVSEVQSSYDSCQETLRTNIQTLVNQTSKTASTSRVDINVVVEKACQHLITSMDCSSQVLLRSCSPFVDRWYYKVFTEMIQPTLSDYRCQLYMPIIKIINLFFVSLAAAVAVGVAIYLFIQRYKSFMRSKMNFVFSVIPKARRTLKKFDPIKSPRTKKIAQTAGEGQTDKMAQTTGERQTAEQTAAAASSGTQPPPIDPAAAHVLEELAKASSQTAPGQRKQPSSWWGSWFGAT